MAKEQPDAKWRRAITGFITWGPLFPLVVGYTFAIYMIAPTSLVLFIAIFAGIMMRNIISYYSKDKGFETGPKS